jgi:hypothetical protein
VGQTATVKVTWPYGGLPHLRYDDKRVVTCEWGTWADNGWPLYIKGVGKGTETVRLTKGEDQTEDIVAKIKVTVK